MESRVIILSMVTLCVVIGIAKMGLKHSKRDKMGPARPLKRRICGFTVLLMILVGVTFDQKLKMYRQVARSVEIGRALNEQNVSLEEKPQEKRWSRRDGRKLGSAKDVWGFVQGAISHAVDKVEDKTSNIAHGADIFGDILEESADYVIDKIKNEIDSSSSEEEISSDQIEPVSLNVEITEFTRE
jgi:hypothetical protein